MNSQELIARLDEEYDRTTGFVGQVRDGRLDPVAKERFFALLRSIDPALEHFERRLVSLLWYVPFVIGWQVERAKEHGALASDLAAALDETTNELERILGIP